jgi:tetratricopeptide (TPR) repeat protein
MAKTLLALLLAAVVSAQRPKPAFDPETREGLLIQQIQQERDSAEKLRYLEQFAVQFPAHPAIAWVYDQLQPALFKIKEYDQTMRIGGLRLAIEPANLEAANLALRSAEAKHETEALVKWANKVFDVLAKVGPGQAAAAEAKQLQAYAVFCLHSAAAAAQDPHQKLELLQTLQTRDPNGPFAAGLIGEMYAAYEQLGDKEQSYQFAEKVIRDDPTNVDMVLAATEYLFQKEQSRDKIIAYATRAVELLEKRPKPVGVSDEEWEKKRLRALGMANYMGGVSAAVLNQHGRTDTMLRAALPHIRDNQAMEATALYLLGVANYHLAESGNRTRAFDALKFTERCAAMKSPFQAQAIKNIASIKSDYNLQ